MYAYLNQKVVVNLTQKGKEVYVNYYKGIFENYDISIKKKYIDLIKEKIDDPISFTLWELMNVFGGHIYPGSDTMFENATIEIIEDDNFY